MEGLCGEPLLSPGSDFLRSIRGERCVVGWSHSELCLRAHGLNPPLQAVMEETQSFSIVGLHVPIHGLLVEDADGSCCLGSLDVESLR